MIYIEPLGGLANRMRVIASALALQKETGEQIVCFWIPKTDLNARFEDLFLPIKHFHVRDKLPFKYKYLKSSFQSHPLKFIIANSINNFSNINLVIKEKDVMELIWGEKLDLVKLSQINKYLYIKTCENFFGGTTEADFFKPVPSLQSIIDERTSAFPKTIIGVHIRRTDCIKSINQSPTELFIQKLDKQLEVEPNTSFYLATDDAQEEKLLKNRYGSRILTHKKILDRDSLQGIRDALVDLYSLAATDAIWGSYSSSFSEMAATIGKKKMEIVKHENLNLP